MLCPYRTRGVAAVVMSSGRWTGERQGDVTGATTGYFWEMVRSSLGAKATGREVDGIVVVVVVVVDV